MLSYCACQSFCPWILPNKSSALFPEFLPGRSWDSPPLFQAQRLLPRGPSPELVHRQPPAPNSRRLMVVSISRANHCRGIPRQCRVPARRRRDALPTTASQSSAKTRTISQQANTTPPIFPILLFGFIFLSMGFSQKIKFAETLAIQKQHNCRTDSSALQRLKLANSTPNFQKFRRVGKSKQLLWFWKPTQRI